MSKKIIEFGIWKGIPIKWLVLSEDEQKMFLVTERDIFDHCFNPNTQCGNKWSESEIRTVLYDEFLSCAFTEAEKNEIITTTLTDTDDDTLEEKVFLLNKTEAKKFLTIEERSLYFDWWLRNVPPNNTSCAFCVDSDGNFSWNYVRYVYGIRPALYLKKHTEPTK